MCYTVKRCYKRYVCGDCPKVETYTHFKMWAFIGLTLALTFGLLGIGAYQKRAEISANWSKYRHDPLYMFFGYFFKPDDDPRTRLEFATDTFKDEIMYILDGVFATMLAPIFKIFKLFTDVLSETGNGLFTVKTLFAKLFEKWNQMTDVFVRRFQSIFHQARMTFIRLFTSLERSFGIATSAVYTGLATVMSIASFIELVIIIMIVILAILFAMMIFLFFVLWPVAPLIGIGAAIVGIAAGAAAGAGGAALDGFCFTEDTLIQTLAGPVRIADIQLDTQLHDGNIVTGIMMIDSANSPIYNLFGVNVSGTHIVYDAVLGPIHVKNHPDAIPINYKVAYIYCLITSHRKIPVVTSNGIQLFADWEELADDKDLYAWHQHVSDILNGAYNHYTGPTTDNLSSESVFSGTTSIWTPSGPSQIRGLRPGNYVMDASNKQTRVTGIVRVSKSEVKSAIPLDSGAYMSAGVWLKTKNGEWAQPKTTVPVTEEVWYSLFTESGTYLLLEPEYIGTAVRDFSDVGADRIHDTYDWVLDSLNQNVQEQ